VAVGCISAAAAGTPVRVQTPRGLQRLNAFADAVVAIAITLLILPLVDISATYRGDLGAVLGDHASQLFAFGLSFAVIARLWVAHHRISENLRLYNHAVLVWTIAWVFTIVFMPLPTELLGRGPITRGSAALYIATLLASTISLSALAWLTGHRPELRHPEAPAEELDRLTGSAWGTPAAIAVALILTLVAPSVGLYGLLLLFLEPWATRIIRCRYARRQAHSRSLLGGAAPGPVTSELEEPDDLSR
jgi:uncharacterized membrane protein